MECDQDLCLNFWYDFKKLLWQDELNPRVRCAFGNVLNIMPSANDYWTRLWMVQLHVMSKARSIWSWNICGGWGMQQFFHKDGLNLMLVTKKLVLSEVSTEVAARPIKIKLQLLFRDLLLPLSALNSLAGLVSGRTAFQNLAQLKPQFGSNTSHIDLSPNCL